MAGKVAVNEKQGEDGTAGSSKGSMAGIVKKLLAKGKEKGFVTYDEFNKSLPAEKFSSEQIEDAMAVMSDAGVQMVESEDHKREQQNAYTQAKALISYRRLW